MKINLLLMGPVSPPYTGQSVAFTTIANYYAKQYPNMVSVVNLSNKNGILSGFLLCIRISRTLLFNRINVIYFTCSRSFLGSLRDVVMLFWARIFKITVINHLHGDDFKRFYSNSSIVYKKILKWCYDGVDTSIVLFDEMKPLFNDFPKMNIKVVANAYSSALDSLPSDKFIRNADIEFLFLSNIMESKGIFILLEAFDSVLKVNSDCKLTIAGAFMGDSISECKETKSKFEDKYNKLKQMYDKRINYVGVVKGETKKELLWKSDIFVLPTFYITEAFPVSILEAMRAGCYIISTNHNYIPQIVSPDNGELAKPNSPSSLQAVIEKILKNKERLNQVQRHNIKHAIVNFGEDKYISEVTGIINENLHHHCLLQQ